MSVSITRLKLISQENSSLTAMSNDEKSSKSLKLGVFGAHIFVDLYLMSYKFSTVVYSDGSGSSFLESYFLFSNAL